MREQVSASTGLRKSTVLGAACGVALLALLIWHSDPARTWGTMRTVEPGLLALAVLCNIPLVLVRTLRAQAVLRALHHPIGFGRMLLIQLVGQTLSSMTPAASGDLVRAYFWRRGDQVPASRGVAAVAFERIASFTLLTLVGLALALAFTAGTAGLVLAAALTSGVLALPWVVSRVPSSAERRLLRALAGLPRVGRFAATLEQAFDALRDLLDAPAFLLAFTLLTFMAFAINGTQLWLLLVGLGGGGGIPLWTAIGVFALAQTGGTLSTLPFALGTMELFTAGLLVRGGLTIGRAAPAALLLRMVITVPLALGAVAAYLLLMERQRSEGLEPAPSRELV